MKIIITGASGHFGRGTVEGLLKRMPADDLILISRNPDKLKLFADMGAQTRFGDFDDKASLLEAFKGGDKMLMISTGRVGQRMPQHTNAVTAAKECGVKHVIYTSFIAAVPENPSLAVKDHRGTEELLRDSGLDWTAMRNGHYSDFILAAGPIAVKTGQWISSSGEGKVANVTRQDCINCAVEVLATDGHVNTVYNLTGPELLRIRDIAAIVSEVTGAPIEYVDVDDEGMYAHFDSLGIPRAPIDDNVVEGVPWCSDDMVSFERTIREGYFAVMSNDVEKLTGKKPQSLRDFALAHREELKG